MTEIAKLISPDSLRGDADNLAHSNRDVYPVDVILDAAHTIEKLQEELTAMVARARHCLWHLDRSGPAQDLKAAEKLLRKMRKREGER